ncbi:hypothetical protein FKW77_009738 [Venturia effusa]|uniref:Uncharacterized protein n=1 Tax=Venturia effusa TaxID=50376 RepID=A0A517KXF2_9PEZI|nr:hypothetical protein FKW77_009738 [Venturia effusa]
MVQGLRAGVKAPEEFMTATDARQRLFGFLALPIEISKTVYKQVASSMFTQRRHEDVPSETTDEFKNRNPILFLNKQITREFFLYTQEPNPATGERDRLDGSAPIEYYTSAGWAGHADVDPDEDDHVFQTFMDTPCFPNIKRVEIHINHFLMDMEILMYHLEDINENISSLADASRDYDEIHIVYTEPREGTIRIQHAEYTIVKDRDRGIYKTTFVRRVADEVGNIEVIEEVTEFEGWAIDDLLPQEEYERIVERAEEERLRYFDGEQWRDALGPLNMEDRTDENVKAIQWRPGNVMKKDPWDDEEWDGLEEEDEGGFTLREQAQMCGLSP